MRPVGQMHFPSDWTYRTAKINFLRLEIDCTMQLKMHNARDNIMDDDDNRCAML